MPTASRGDIAIDPGNSNVVWVGTGEANIFRSSNAGCGVFASKDGGKKWDILGDLAFAYVHDLAIHPRDNLIIIATHGRGIWVMDANPINEKDIRER